MPCRARWVVASIACASIAWSMACSLGRGPLLFEHGDDGGAAPPVDLSGDDGSTGAVDVALGESFAIDGLVPSHGPWTGGTRATISGRGFPSTLKVSIGGVALDPSAVFASDPTRAAIETPPGKPGPADVTIRDDAHGVERTLAGGFTYDAFVVDPNQGATTGGTRVSIVGSGTSFGASTTVAIDGKPCTSVAVTDATHLQCVTPADAIGVKDVVVTDANETLHAADAFTYADSPDGYRGGLTGGALAGTIKVLAFDAWTGDPIPGAFAIAGAITKTTNAAGVAQIQDASLVGSVTVTVAATCHQPLTFVAVPVDTVTAYITPTLDPSCAPPGNPDPPSGGGGSGVHAGTIAGELVFAGQEFKPGPWTVPAPTKATERQAAYVFSVTGAPTDAFYLPDPSTAATPDKTGSHGYAYSLTIGPGNATIYALAGIEDRSVTPPTFAAYAMGVARGVQVGPGASVTGVDIPMSTLLDHAVTLAPSPPTPEARGPDRFVANVAVSVGQLGYAIFPNGGRTSLLPLTGNLAFVGMPALDQGLAGERYVIAATAGTGTYLQPPASIVGQVRSTDSNDPIAIGGFLEPPVLTTPSTTPWSGTHVGVTVTGAVDVVRLDVTSGHGLVDWTILAPGAVTTFDLPNLATLAGEVGLVSGPIVTTVYAARADAFTYASLRTGQMGPGGWSAYAYDEIEGVYAP